MGPKVVRFGRAGRNLPHKFDGFTQNTDEHICTKHLEVEKTVFNTLYPLYTCILFLRRKPGYEATCFQPRVGTKWQKRRGLMICNA